MNRCASAVSEPCSFLFPVHRSECCTATSKHLMWLFNGNDAQKHLASDPVTNFYAAKSMTQVMYYICTVFLLDPLGDKILEIFLS